MMKKSTKMFMTAAASLLGVALATGGAYATTGYLTTADAPGQVMHVSGVGPASEHASENAFVHANPNAKGLFGWATDSTHAPKVKDDDKANGKAKDKAEDKAEKHKAAGDKPAPAGKPVKDTTSTKNQPSSSVEGDDDDADENESTPDSSGHVEAVAPGDAVEVERESDDADESDDHADDSDDDSDDSDDHDDDSDDDSDKSDD